MGRRCGFGGAVDWDDEEVPGLVGSVRFGASLCVAKRLSFVFTWVVHGRGWVLLSAYACGAKANRLFKLLGDDRVLFSYHRLILHSESRTLPLRICVSV